MILPSMDFGKSCIFAGGSTARRHQTTPLGPDDPPPWDVLLTGNTPVFHVEHGTAMPGSRAGVPSPQPTPTAPTTPA